MPLFIPCTVTAWGGQVFYEEVPMPVAKICHGKREVMEAISDYFVLHDIDVKHCLINIS